MPVQRETPTTRRPTAARIDDAWEERHAFVLGRGEGSDARLGGFTISNGGGVVIVNASPTECARASVAPEGRSATRGGSLGADVFRHALRA